MARGSFNTDIESIKRGWLRAIAWLETFKDRPDNLKKQKKLVLHLLTDQKFIAERPNPPPFDITDDDVVAVSIESWSRKQLVPDEESYMSYATYKEAKDKRPKRLFNPFYAMSEDVNTAYRILLKEGLIAEEPGLRLTEAGQRALEDLPPLTREDYRFYHEPAQQAAGSAGDEGPNAAAVRRSSSGGQTR